MIRGREEHAEPPEHYNVRGATHIVKLWHVDEYPDLAANEFFCLSAARTAGLLVPKFELSEDGTALVVERFDRYENGYLGFEDFCVLNGLRTDQKYSGGYETRLFRRLREFHARHAAESGPMLARLREAVIANQNVFEVLIDAVRVCSLGQITHALFEVGGQYRRNM